MAIDVRERIAFWNTLRADPRLTGADTRVANVLLFQFMNVNTGRNQAYVATIARLSGVAERSVYRALEKLKRLGLLRIIPTWSARMVAIGHRWFKPRGASIYEWLHSFQTAKLAVQPIRKIKQAAQVPMDPALVAVLARFGHAIADRHGLPPAPSRPEDTIGQSR